ncbi:MAG: helix-turn-helix domain-containing protein [Pyrinomonadaceae bacterium]
MVSSAPALDKIYVGEQFSIHYRRAGRVHWTNDARPAYAALFLLGGAFVWQPSGEEAREAETAAVLLSMPGQAVSVRGTNAELLSVTLSPAYLLEYAVRARLTRADALITFPSHLLTGDSRLQRLARELSDELIEEAAGQELVVRALVEQGMVHLLRRYAGVRRSAEIELSRVGLVDRRVRRAVELMHAQLQRELPLEELAAAAYLSPFHFARLFKKVTGVTPHAYLAALRIEQAQRLLATTDLSITEIGARVGYSSSSHFGKAFRQATDLTPRNFRAALVTR